MLVWCLCECVCSVCLWEDLCWCGVCVNVCVSVCGRTCVGVVFV